MNINLGFGEHVKGLLGQGIKRNEMEMKRNDSTWQEIWELQVKLIPSQYHAIKISRNEAKLKVENHSAQKILRMTFCQPNAKSRVRKNPP